MKQAHSSGEEKVFVIRRLNARISELKSKSIQEQMNQKYLSALKV